MHALGPTTSLFSSTITGQHPADDDRRLGHLAALADGRAGRPSLLDRLVDRLTARQTAAPAPALDCCAAG